MTRDFASELDELRRNYIKALPTKLDELDAAIGNRSAADTRSLAHKLRGTAASYFAPQVSSAAAAIEDAVQVDAPDWTHIEQLLAVARTVVAELT